jgi:hypothetical protein
MPATLTLPRSVRLPSFPSAPLSPSAAERAPEQSTPVTAPATAPAPRTRRAAPLPEWAVVDFLTAATAATPRDLATVAFWLPVLQHPRLALQLLRCAASQRLRDGEILGAHLIRWSYPAAILLTTLPVQAALRTRTGGTLLDDAAARFDAVANLIGGPAVTL